MNPMDLARRVMGAADRWQRRNKWAGVPYAVQKKFGDDQANLVVVSLAWYGFTAIIPLLLVVTNVLGTIGAKSLGTGITNALAGFPVIGDQLNTQGSNALHGSGLALVVGILGLLYGAQGVTQNAQLAMATVWNVPQVERTGFLPRLGRSFAALITIGGAFLINAVITTYINGGTSNWGIRISVLAGLLILNTGLYFATFYLLTAKVIGPRGLLPGAVLGAVAFTALITLGTGLLTHQLKHAESTYGTFGGIIGIVAFLLLLGKLSLYAAELNPVLSRGLYPRALPLVEDLTDADKRVLASVVYQEQRREDQAIGVGFGQDAAEEAGRNASTRARPPLPRNEPGMPGPSTGSSTGSSTGPRAEQPRQPH